MVIYFDQSCKNWENDSFLDEVFVMGAKRHIECLVSSKGWITVSKVKEIFGIEPTRDIKEFELGFDKERGVVINYEKKENNIYKIDLDVYRIM